MNLLGVTTMLGLLLSLGCQGGRTARPDQGANSSSNRELAFAVATMSMDGKELGTVVEWLYLDGNLAGSVNWGPFDPDGSAPGTLGASADAKTIVGLDSEGVRIARFGAKFVQLAVTHARITDLIREAGGRTVRAICPLEDGAECLLAVDTTPCDLLVLRINLVSGRLVEKQKLSRADLRQVGIDPAHLTSQERLIEAGDGRFLLILAADRHYTLDEEVRKVEGVELAAPPASAWLELPKKRLEPIGRGIVLGLSDDGLKLVSEGDEASERPNRLMPLGIKGHACQWRVTNGQAAAWIDGHVVVLTDSGARQELVTYNGKGAEVSRVPAQLKNGGPVNELVFPAYR